jgi:serine/threonine protein kinase
VITIGRNHHGVDLNTSARSNSHSPLHAVISPRIDTIRSLGTSLFLDDWLAAVAARSNALRTAAPTRPHAALVDVDANALSLTALDFSPAFARPVHTSPPPTDVTGSFPVEPTAVLTAPEARSTPLPRPCDYFIPPSLTPRHGDISRTWEFGSVLGDGGVGSVRAAVARGDGRWAAGMRVAVKVVRKKYLRSIEEIEGVVREVELHREVCAAGGHPRIVTLFEVWEDGEEGTAPTAVSGGDGGCIYFVLERMDRGDLRSLVSTRGVARLPESVVRRVIDQLLDAVAWLHAHGILHGDIKPANVLLAGSDLGRDSTRAPFAVFVDSVKLCDFGNARRSRDARYYKTTGDVSTVPWSCMSGTLGYVAPEVLARKHFSANIDVWSLGCILYELVAGFSPFHPYRLPLLADFPSPPWAPAAGDATSGTAARGLPFISEEARDLVGRMLHVDAAKRVSAESARSNSFFSSR